MNKILIFLFAFLILSSAGFSCAAISSTNIGSLNVYTLPIWITNGDCSLADIQTYGYTTQFGGTSSAVGSTGTTASNVTKYAQNFTITSNTDIDSITLRAVVNGGYIGDDTAVVTVRIETSDVNGSPSGILVSPNAITNVSASELQHAYMYSTSTQSGGSHTWVFPSTVSLAAGTYNIVVNLTGRWEAGYSFGIQYSTTSTYAGGQYKVSTVVGTWTNYETNDLWFLVNKAGISNYTYDAISSKGIVAQNCAFYPTGTGALVIGAGETLTFTQPTVAGNGYDFYFSMAGGGAIKTHGTRDNPARINSSSSTARKAFGINTGYSSKLLLDYLNYDIYTGSAIINTVNGGMDSGIIRGGWWNNWYAQSPGIYIYSTDTSYQHQGTYQFYGVTFNKTASSTAFIVTAGSPSQRPVSFINCDFNEAVVNANGVIATRSTTGYNLINKQDYYMVFAGCRRNGNPLVIGDIYSYTTDAGFIFGNMVTPTVVNSSNMPLEDVVVTVTPQYGIGTDVPYMFNGQSRDLTRTVLENNIFENIMYNVYPRLTPLAVTNSSGVPVDDLGEEVLWIPYTFYSGGTASTVGTMTIKSYLGGSSTSIRSTEDTTWANDGTDEGSIITFSHETYGGNLTVVNPSSAFTSNITLGSGGSALASDYPMEALPFVAVMISIVLIWVSRKIDSNDPLKILYLILSLLFIVITIFSNIVLAKAESLTDIVNINYAGMTVMVAVILIVLMYVMINFMKKGFKGMYGEHDD